MIFQFKKNPLLRFLSIALLLYVLWYVVYELWLHPKATLDLFVIDNLIVLSSFTLELLGYPLIENPFTTEYIRTMGVEGSAGVWIGDPCNGISLFALFTGFVIAYPGPIKIKLLFIPIGLITIHLLNVFRIVALCIIDYHYPPEYLDFNHTYTFTIIVYAYVFFLWIIWANKFKK